VEAHDVVPFTSVTSIAVRTGHAYVNDRVNHIWVVCQLQIQDAFAWVPRFNLPIAQVTAHVVENQTWARVFRRHFKKFVSCVFLQKLESKKL